MPRLRPTMFLGLVCVAPVCLFAEEVSMKSRPLVVAHRGLLKHAPENTLSNFRACLELRLGFEVDVRRSKDGVLVCVHDETVDRTTNGHGAVSALTLNELQRLDAGTWFSPAFQGERIPTFDEVLSVVEKHGREPVMIKIDLKAQNIEADCVRVAKNRGVLDRLLFIGNAIGDAKVRRALREADPAAHVACLAQTAKDLSASLSDNHSDWAYLRFVPSRDELDLVRKSGRRAIIAGPTVAGLERANWRGAMTAGINGFLTDYPLELAEEIRLDAEKTIAVAPTASETDKRFAKLAARYVDESPALSPVSATTLGDHRYDHQLDEISEAARQHERGFALELLSELDKLDRAKLSRDNQVDHQLLAHQLKSDLWRLDQLQEWAWNPILYTQIPGSAIYGLMAREFAPVEQRLASVTTRLEKLPKLYEQIRETLDAKRVPPIHAETAIKQNRGVLSIIENTVRPQMSKLTEPEQQRLLKAITVATEAVEQQQQWLEKELLPNARGDARLGAKLYDEKLAFTLGTGLTRQEIRDRAEFELRRVRAEMYTIARQVQLKQKPDAKLPEEPSPEQQQEVILAALEQAYADVPPRDGVVPAARKSLELCIDFVRKHDLVTIPDDPLDIIEMPEFQRGVSIAYCDSPGPLEVGLKTFYAVAPLPADWTDAQCASFLREYNIRSIHNLTVHEAMPGHFLQLAHANRSPNRLRALLGSGTFVEGWACYTEQMMSEEGFLADRDPLMRLITLKWYLRTMANAILDQSVHVDGIRREDAMRLMMRDTFQEEREAAGKWTRAQVTSAQLATYFVGYQEHRDLRAAAKAAWGDIFTLKRYHDGVISFGSPPVRFVKSLLLNERIPSQ